MTAQVLNEIKYCETVRNTTVTTAFPVQKLEEPMMTIDRDGNNGGGNGVGGSSGGIGGGIDRGGYGGYDRGGGNGGRKEFTQDYKEYM